MEEKRIHPDQYQVADDSPTKVWMLTLTVMPDRTIPPEWIEVGQAISETCANQQAALFDRFLNDKKRWLFYLGFHEPDTELSLSLNYFISVAAIFVRRLSRIPELESLRHKATVVISDGEKERHDALIDYEGNCGGKD